ncbi:TerD family protein [Streptomyces sp. ICBB 8177]|uniref:TerD family protein n=1 Tax=Streptomyces sp. ICBB 8177 TaxID=563922 RepID=UPI000D683AC5|nr:TerD family protein [Streptomyces sp. ICBB 8177]PWI43534.1 stress-induced protein [Streptomyces sp. ICBB 8177]
MTPGSNIPLPAARVTVEVTAPVALDVSGLLLTADGKVRSDDDFVFYNQPSAPGVTHRAGAIEVDTGAVPDGVEKVVVTASPDEAGRGFAGAEPTATIRDADGGAVLATFTPPALGSETALVVVEIYRRGGAWKARAVGQGYANGLAGIATDFGVTVEEPTTQAGTPAAPTAPASTPAVGTPAAAAGSSGAGSAVTEPAAAAPPPPPFPAPAAPAFPAAPPAPFTSTAPPPAPAPFTPSAPPSPPPPPPAGAVPAGFPPPWAGGAPAPAPAGPPAASFPPPTAASPAAGRINLDKGRVSLSKNQSVSLVKGGRPLLSTVRMGLGWEPARRGRSIDLDASVIAYGPRRDHRDSCYFGRLRILGDAVRHAGDNLTGRGSGDDESITVDLGRVPADVTSLVFTVNSFSGQKFTQVAKAYCRLLDDASGEELVRFDLTNSEAQTGVVMCKLVRQPTGEWEMTAIGQYVKARTVRGMVDHGAATL